MEKTFELLAIGDLFLDAVTLREVIGPTLPQEVALRTVQWELSGLEELQRVNLAVEQAGPDGIQLPENVVAAATTADIVFTQFCPVNATLLDAAPKLRVIGVGRSGVQNVNMREATARRIAVCNTVGRNAHAVAEYTIGLILSEARNIGRAHAALKKGVWRKEYPNDASVPELHGRTLGLVGLGQVGVLVVKKLRGFCMDVIVYDPYVSDARATEVGVELTSLPDLMRRSDFVSVHAKLTEETRLLLDGNMLGLMKPTAYLVNTARAELVDEEALVACLRENRIAGAALDVFSTEPPPADAELLTLDNVTLSPHQAGVTVDAYRTTARLFAENMGRLWSGDDLPMNLINDSTRPALADFKKTVREALERCERS